MRAQIAEQELKRGDRHKAKLTNVKSEITAEGYLVRWPRMGLPEGDAVELVVRASWDDGATWLEIRRVTVPGGPLTDKAGKPVTEGWIKGTWPGEYDPPDKDGNQRRRPLQPTDIEVERIALKPCRCSIDLETF